MHDLESDEPGSHLEGVRNLQLFKSFLGYYSLQRQHRPGSRKAGVAHSGTQRLSSSPTWRGVFNIPFSKVEMGCFGLE